MSTLKKVDIFATNLPDAWHQSVFSIITPDNARKRIVDHGSYAGEYRLEFDFVVVHITHPGARSLLPDIPKHLDIPNPVESM